MKKKMDKEKLAKLKKSLKEDEYIIPGYHPKEAVKKINKLKLTGTARKEAFIACYVQPRKGKRNEEIPRYEGPGGDED